MLQASGLLTQEGGDSKAGERTYRKRKQPETPDSTRYRHSQRRCSGRRSFELPPLTGFKGSLPVHFGSHLPVHDNISLNA